MSTSPNIKASARPFLRVRRHIGRYGLVLTSLLVLALETPLEAQLAEKSPFLPPNHGATEKPAPRTTVPAQGPLSRELEFRGVVSLGGQRQFSIFSKKANTGYWINENQSVEGIQVRGFDPANATVIISMNGRSERLTLKTATDRPLPVAASPRTDQAKAVPALPNQQINTPTNNKRRVIPRRRLILPNETSQSQNND